MRTARRPQSPPRTPSPGSCAATCVPAARRFTRCLASPGTPPPSAQRASSPDRDGCCPTAAPTGPPFVIVIKRVNGTRTAYRSTDLACGGREAVARYLGALAYQRADAQAATTSGYALNCSPPNGDDAEAVAPPMDAVRAAHSAGLLCSYPVFDPSRPGRLEARDYHAVALTGDELSVVHRALTTSSFTATAAVT